MVRNIKKKSILEKIQSILMTREIKKKERASFKRMRTLFSEGHYLEALDLFQGDEKSGFTLNKIGKMFHFGVGVTQDFNKARSLYEASLECQYFPTAHHLGRLYLNGEGVSRDVEKALYYYKIAADNGVEEAHDFVRVLSPTA